MYFNKLQKHTIKRGKKLNYLYIIKSTHIVKSSEHIASQRLNEELFLRIPLKEFGGLGKFGRKKLSISIEPTSCSCPRDFSNASSVTPENESSKIPLVGHI